MVMKANENLEEVIKVHPALHASDPHMCLVHCAIE